MLSFAKFKHQDSILPQICGRFPANPAIKIKAVASSVQRHYRFPHDLFLKKTALCAGNIGRIGYDQIKFMTAYVFFILVSKSGTTLETLTNETFVKNFLKDRGLNPAKHMIAVTSKSSPLASSSDYLAAFFMDDFIGGRYSSTSAVGGAVLSLAFGPDYFERFLSGAAEADRLDTCSNPMENPAMLDALIGVYERNVLGYPSTAVLPYSQALSRFPAHLQQLDMESNGKSVNRFGEPVEYPTGPVIFGEPGTNGQHSFYQLLHQGTDIIPLQFIGFRKNQTEQDIIIQDSTSQQKLCAKSTVSAVT